MIRINNNNNNNNCSGYDFKLHSVVEFRRGIMRLPFTTLPQQEREENREQSRSNDTGTDTETDIVRSQYQEPSFNLQSENENDAQGANSNENSIRQILCMISGSV